MRLFRELRARIQAALPPDSLRSRYAHAASWSLLATALSTGSRLVTSIIAANILGRVGFGHLGMVLSSVAMFGTLAGLGLGLTASKYVAELRGDAERRNRAGRIAGLLLLTGSTTGAAAALILYWLAPSFASALLNAPELATELRIGCCLLVLNVLVGVLAGILSGLEAFRALARVTLGQAVAGVPLVAGGVLLAGLPGALIGYVLAASFEVSLLTLVVISETKRYGVTLTLRGVRAEMPVLWHFSIPGALAGAMVGPVGWGANALLANQTGGYSELGIFTAANQWRTALLFLPSVLERATIPLMSNALGTGRRDSTRKLMWATVLLNASVALPIGIAVIALSPWIMAQYGEGFREGWPVLTLCTATAVLLAVQSPFGTLIAASGRMWIGFAMNAAWALVLLATCWALLDHGALGLGWAYLISYLLHTTWVGIFGYHLSTSKP